MKRVRFPDINRGPSARALFPVATSPKIGIDSTRRWRTEGALLHKEKIMPRNLAIAIVQAAFLLPLTSTSVPAAQAEFGTEKEARSMLERAVVTLKGNKDKALEMFNKGEGGFKDRDLYVYCANASDGILTAHPTLKGKPLRDIKGKHGRPVGETEMENATEGTIKETTYWWPRPGSDKPLEKTTFYTKPGDQICAVGYYKINAPELTERDSYIIAQALYEFIR